MRSLLIEQDKRQELPAHHLNQEAVPPLPEAPILHLMIAVHLIVILVHLHLLLEIEEEEDLQRDGPALVSAGQTLKGDDPGHHEDDK